MRVVVGGHVIRVIRTRDINYADIVVGRFKLALFMRDELISVK